jgi:hypothetical protein
VLDMLRATTIEAKSSGGGFVVDGVPRTMAQAPALYEFYQRKTSAMNTIASIQKNAATAPPVLPAAAAAITAAPGRRPTAL